MTLLTVTCVSWLAACGGISIERYGDEPAGSGATATSGNGEPGSGAGSGGAIGATNAASTGGTGASSSEEFGGVGGEPAVACDKHRAETVCVVGTLGQGGNEVLRPGDAF